MANQVKRVAKKSTGKKPAVRLTPAALDDYLESVVALNVYDAPPKDIAEWAKVLSKHTAEVLETLTDDHGEEAQDAIDRLGEAVEIKLLGAAMSDIGIDNDEQYEWRESQDSDE
jgi:hypothetical protein